MTRFIIKKVNKPKKTYKPMGHTKPMGIQKSIKEEIAKEEVKPTETPKQEVINDNKKVNDMDTKEKITLATAILNSQEDVKVKKVRKDKGLIERTESSKIILTEDNKELLND